MMSSSSPPARPIESVAFMPLGDTQRKPFILHHSVASLALARGGEQEDASEYRLRDGRLQKVKADLHARLESDSSDDEAYDDDNDDKHSQASAPSAAYDEPCKHLDSRVVSRMHARLSWRQGPPGKGDGCSSGDIESKGSSPSEEADKRPMRLMLTDLKSTHGTYVSRLGQTTDIKLTPNQAFELQDGDTITIGRQVEKSGEMFYAPKFTGIFSFTKPVKKEFFEECARASMQALLEKQKLEEEQVEDNEDYEDYDYEDEEEEDYDYYEDEEEEDYNDYLDDLDEVEREYALGAVELIDNDDVIVKGTSASGHTDNIELNQEVIDLTENLDDHSDAGCACCDDEVGDDQAQSCIEITTATISKEFDLAADGCSSSSSVDDCHATPETSDIEEKTDEQQGEMAATASKGDDQEIFTATEDVSNTSSLSGVPSEPSEAQGDQQAVPDDVAENVTSKRALEEVSAEDWSPILSRKRSAETAQLDEQDEGHVNAPPRSEANGIQTTTASVSSPLVDPRPRKRLGFGAGVVAGVVVGAVGTFAGLSSLALDDNFLP